MSWDAKEFRFCPSRTFLMLCWIIGEKECSCCVSTEWLSTPLVQQVSRAECIPCSLLHEVWNVVGVRCMTTGVERAPQKLLVLPIALRTTG